MGVFRGWENLGKWILEAEFLEQTEYKKSCCGVVVRKMRIYE